LKVFFLLDRRSKKTLVHELLPGKAEPPLGRPSVGGAEHPFAHSGPRLMAQLEKVLLVRVYLLLRGGLGINRIEGERRVTRDGKLGDGQRIHFGGALALVFALGQLLKALGDVQGHVDKCPVAFSLDFISSEENIGFEILKSFINDIRPISRHEGGGSPVFSSDGQEGKVANRVAGDGDIAVVCRHSLVDLERLVIFTLGKNYSMLFIFFLNI